VDSRVTNCASVRRARIAGIHAERCAGELWPRSVQCRSGSDASAVASCVVGKAVWGHIVLLPDLRRFLSPRAASPDRTAVRYRVLTRWTLPLPLLLFAGAVALWPLAAIVRRPTSVPRLISEAYVTALAIIGLVWLASVVLWLIEQRW
jgi:hypothetical protein